MLEYKMPASRIWFCSRLPQYQLVFLSITGIVFGTLYRLSAYPPIDRKLQ